MATYTTKSGDMWDAIAYRVYGSTEHTGKLMKANMKHIATFIFPAGVVLNVPDLDKFDIDSSYVPPWRK